MSKPWSRMSERERAGRGDKHWKQLRAMVLAASDICWMCGKPGADTVDHLIPLSRGGSNAISNLRPAHGRRQPWGCPGNYGRKDRNIVVNKTTREW